MTKFNLEKLAGWSVSDGECQGHWASKVLGSRCIWSCRWSVPRSVNHSGRLKPDDLLPVEAMGKVEILCELRDVIAWPVLPARRETLTRRDECERMIGLLQDPGESWLPEARKLLKRWRETYPDYVAGFLGELESGRGGLARPGWPVAGLEVASG